MNIGDCYGYYCLDHKADDIPSRFKAHMRKKERMNVLIKKAFQTPMDQLKMKARGKKRGGCF